MNFDLRLYRITRRKSSKMKIQNIYFFASHSFAFIKQINDRNEKKPKNAAISKITTALVLPLPLIRNWGKGTLFQSPRNS